MDIHEYQAKVLLADFGMPIARGGIAYSPEQAAYRAMELGGEKWVVKAQIHSGARGKAGGIKVCATENEVMDAANELLGRRLVTNQTGPQGKLVGRLYIEEATDIDREIYLAFVLDRSSERIMCVASSAGGMDIEEPTRSCAYRSNRQWGCRIFRPAKLRLRWVWIPRKSPKQ
jgi:malate-CoA ligase subunit beta